MERRKILVVGSFIVDVTAFAPRFPGDGETIVGRRMKFGPGGKGSNQATAASRAGAEVVMVTKIGRDFLARFAHEHYRAEEMTERYVYQANDVDTGAAFIEVNEASGENRIVVMKGANAQLTTAEVMAAETEIVGASVALTQLEASFDAAFALKQLAQKHRKPIVLNPAPFQDVPDDLFVGIDYFTPNETEAEYYSGVKIVDRASARAAAKRLIGLGVHNVVITLGKTGVYYWGTEGERLIPPPDVRAVDTTGAGDAFNGGFCVALAEGKNIAAALAFANCVAAIAVTRHGTSPAMPYRREIDALQARFYGQLE